MSFFNYPVWRSVLWQVIGFACIFLLRPQGIHHLGQVPLFCTVLSLVVGLQLWFNPDMRSYLYDSLTNKAHQKAALVFLVIIVVIYRQFTPTAEHLETLPNAHFAHMAYPYILTKTVDITFQQIAYSMFIHDLLAKKITLFKTQMICGTLLALSHLMTLTSLPTSIAIIFIGAGGLAGLLFPLAITHKKGGFIPAFLLHWGYYLILGIFYNLYFQL